MADFVAYEPAAPRCSGKAQPGCVEFMEWVLKDFGRGATNLGIYNCRAVRGSTNRSIHGDGRAVDPGFPVIGGKANRAGWDLLNLLLPHVRPLGIQMIIWDRRVWSRRTPNGAPYRGTVPHIDHLHIEFNWHAARTLTRERVRQIVGIPAPKPTPSPKPAPPVHQEDDDMGEYWRDSGTGAIYHVYGERYRHLSGAQWKARSDVARLGGKQLPVKNMTGRQIADLFRLLDLIKDPT